MGAKQSYPSNHGTHPKAYPHRTFARSFPSTMATAMAPPPPPATQQRYKSSQSSMSSVPKTTPPATAKPTPAVNTPKTPEGDVIDLDEPWIVELQEEMEREIAAKAIPLYDTLLKALADAGPLIDHNKANTLQANYQKELYEMRQAHQKEVDKMIQMERHYRLWSMGEEDPNWEDWEAIREEQECILDNVPKPTRSRTDGNDVFENYDNDDEIDEVERQVRETAQEQEQASRTFTEWERIQPQLQRDRAQWREGMMESQSRIKERRRQDDLESQTRMKSQQDLDERIEQLAAEARMGSAALRGQPSLATLYANGEPFVPWKPGPSSDTQSRASFADSSWSSDTSFTTSDTTAASSIYVNSSDSPLPRQSNARPIPVYPSDERNRFSSGSGYYSTGFEERQRTPYGSFSGSSRMHGFGHTPSPTPPSHMPSSNPSHAKSGITDAIPERWIPPGHQVPREKPSMHFDSKSSKETGGPPRSRSALFGESPAPPHPPIPEDEMSRSSAVPEAHSQRLSSNLSSSTLNPGTTTDHHPSSVPLRSTSSYPFSSSTLASSAGGASGTSASAAAVPLSSTFASSSTTRIPSSSFQAPAAPGLRSKPLPQQPTPPPGSTSASQPSSAPATKPSFPSTHTHVPPQRHHSFASGQPSPTEPKSFHSQPPARSVSVSSGSSYSASIPSFGARASFTSATTAVPTSPIEEPATSRASGAAASASASQPPSHTKNAAPAHSATHATQTPFSKTSFSQTHSQPTSAQSQNTFASTEDYRNKLRQQYVADEERRAEEERLRRLEEEQRKQEQQEEERRNERRAEEAKKRGEERRRDEERRRQEEMARDAERREQERKARKAAAAAAAAAGMSGSYPGAGFAHSGAYGSNTTGSTGSGMPGTGFNSSTGSGSYSSAGASVTSPPTPPPSSTPTVPEIWEAHEKQWAAMAMTKVPNLRFRSMPWPVLTPITNPEQLLPIKIAQFIFHAQHSQGKSKERRLREALLKWHPDRFDSKWLPKVAPEDREKVSDGAGRVVRALNELLNGLNNNGFGE